jgi:release factor glutamine methyltransferase
MTLREWLVRGEAQLREGPHPEKARLDAEEFLLGTLAQNKAWLLTHLDKQISEYEADSYIGLIERRLEGEPVQYILGFTEFYGLPFRVNSDVLIPRPETEILVERVLSLADSFPSPRILDVGAGSGAIAVAVAHKLPPAQISAIEISDDALAIARWNARRNSVYERTRFLHSDLLASVSAERFEIIVSNPPYIPTADRGSLAVEVRDYEPALALFAGNDGLDVYRRLIPQAHGALVPGGFIALEIGYGQADAIRDLLASAGFTQIEFTPDLQSIPRVATALRP